MSLLEMSLTGGILILAVAILRAAAQNRLPRGAFRVLWGVAVLRLLVPASVPSPWSVYTLAESEPVRTVVQVPAIPAAVPVLQAAPPAAEGGPAGGGSPFPVWTALWLAGALAWAVYYAAAYIRCRRRFRESLPVDCPAVQAWQENCRLWRRISVRQSGCVDAPLTYGTIRPVILLPKSTNWTQTERLAYVLEHELAHIRRFDAAAKLVMTAAVCVHWFNPLVWLMRSLANRDRELSCDEAVVRRFGADSRPAYARALIAMEERRSGLGPFASAFSKNAIEERIRAIMNMRKRSLAAVLAAVLLVCGVSVAFATSAAEKGAPPRPNVQDGAFTWAELDRLAGLWFEGYQDMTVAAYQEKMWAERDNPQDLELLDRYGQYGVKAGYFGDPAASKEANAFDDYFYHVYEPLTAEQWQRRQFSGAAVSGGAIVEYICDLIILDRGTLTVGEYERAWRDAEAGLQGVLEGYTAQELADWEGMQDALADKMAGILRGLSSDRLTVSLQSSFYTGSDVALYAEVSGQVGAEWDQLLSPYTAFGLRYTFDDPDHDGNGLAMTFQGREVRGIFDGQEGVWITEHTGNGAYGPDAVELYAVYTDGVLTGLRLATAEEQTAWTGSREQQKVDPEWMLHGQEEEREFPHAARADYDSLLSLRTAGYREMALADFNQLVLDWCNENSGACDRIFCDVIWDDYAVELTAEEREFAAQTCHWSGNENAMRVRSLYTGRTEDDPVFARSLPAWQVVEHMDSSVTTAWCELYYSLSYHIPDKSAVTVGERDRCIAGMENAIRLFWEETPVDELLAMTEEDVVARFQAWAAENSTEGICINPVTAGNVHFAVMDERGID